MTETTAPATVRGPRAMRLHVLEITPKAGGEITKRLVRAKTDRGAIAHVSDRTITCRPATAEDAYELARAGVEIETAGETSEPQPADPEQALLAQLGDEGGPVCNLREPWKEPS